MVVAAAWRDDPPALDVRERTNILPAAGDVPPQHQPRELAAAIVVFPRLFRLVPTFRHRRPCVGMGFVDAASCDTLSAIGTSIRLVSGSPWPRTPGTSLSACRATSAVVVPQTSNAGVGTTSRWPASMRLPTTRSYLLNRSFGVRIRGIAASPRESSMRSRLIKVARSDGSTPVPATIRRLIARLQRLS